MVALTLSTLVLLMTTVTVLLWMQNWDASTIAIDYVNWMHLLNCWLLLFGLHSNDLVSVIIVAVGWRSSSTALGPLDDAHGVIT
jgi:hypothetical protein